MSCVYFTILQAFNGQRGFKDFENCDACGNERAEKKCSKCKPVLFCQKKSKKHAFKFWYLYFQANQSNTAIKLAKSFTGSRTRKFVRSWKVNSIAGVILKLIKIKLLVKKIMLFQPTTSQLQSSRKMALGADDYNRKSPCHTSWNSPAQNYR